MVGMKKWLRSVMCFLGFHQWENRVWSFGQISINGHACRHCERSPTWER